MAHPILGLHHVTATVDEAQPDLDMFAGALGLRLVKKTVNFDNHHVFHFYYGDEHGLPGTIWTTFLYHGRCVRVGTKGAGQVTATAFSVGAASLEFWKARLNAHGVTVRELAPRFGQTSIAVSDPSGLVIELIAGRDERPGWTRDIDATHAVRGLHSVTIAVRAPGDTVAMMTDLLGFEVVDEMDGRVRLAVNGGGPGRTVDVVHDPDTPLAVNGLGTVHHVAFAIATGDEQRRVREDLLRVSHRVTDILDRQYFQSIYFREPGGTLFEIATVQPGFAVDESPDELGRSLKLPPWEEPNRALIEAGLPEVHTRWG